MADETQRGGSARHRKVLRDSIQGLTKPAFKRLIHRAGVTRASILVYEELRGIVMVKLEEVIRDAVIFTEHARRKTVMVDDVEAAIEIIDNKFSALVPSHQAGRCVDRESNKSEDTETRRRHRPGRAADLDIKFQQKNADCFSFAKLSFDRVVREVAQDYHVELRFQETAVLLLQQYIEGYIVELVHLAGLQLKQGERETLFPKDLQIVRKIKGERA